MLSMLLALQGGGFLLGLLICLYRTNDRHAFFGGLRRLEPAWAFSIMALLLYSMTHLNSRYLGSFIAICFIAAYVGLRIPRRLAIGISIFGLLWAAAFSSMTKRYCEGYRAWTHATVNQPWATAEGLRQLGIPEGVKIASACYSNRGNVLWARLMKAHIVAETDWTFDWTLSPDDQHRVLAALAQNGARIAVIDHAPASPVSEWNEINHTGYYFYRLALLP
jgi:hypothetical protein